jgi:hypothetical protein
LNKRYVSNSDVPLEIDGLTYTTSWKLTVTASTPPSTPASTVSSSNELGNRFYRPKAGPWAPSIQDPAASNLFVPGIH